MKTKTKAEPVEHPAHYGGAENPYEHVKVAIAWDLNYMLASATKYICRAGRKPGVDALEDLRKARFWVDYEVKRLEKIQAGR